MIRHYYIRIIFTLLIICTISTAHDANDFRIVEFDDRFNDVTRFSLNHIDGYVPLSFDIPGSQIIVGARNYIVRLSIDSLKPLQVTNWPADDGTIEYCINRGQDKDKCQNYIRTLIVRENRVFTCGTFAFSPTCTWRMISDLGTVLEETKGQGKCPLNPSHNITVLMTDEGNLYSATYTDFTARDPAIYRTMGPSKPLRTMQYNTKWLNEPNFVSAHEIGDYIYIFFQEVALEQTCEKKVYSRVARVCKHDPGGNLLLENNWTTYRKGRLNCSLPGRFPYNFDHVQSSYYSEDKQLIYVLFTIERNGLLGGAVCVYNMTSLDATFSGPFKYPGAPGMPWQRHRNSHPEGAQCEARRVLNRSLQMQHMLINAQKYQMMNEAIQPTNQRPELVMEHDRYSKIVVDHVHAKHHQVVTVLFAASLGGTIRKYVKYLDEEQFCLAEEINLTPDYKPKVITNMIISKEKGMLYVTTNDEVMKVPVQRCHRWNTRIACEKAMDPYCGWDNVNRICTPPPNGHTDLHYWHQPILQCPTLDEVVHGGWGHWAHWNICHQKGRSQCLCRERTCSSPTPRNGGNDCPGHRIEVSNCTIDGSWTDWSSWSACSQTCGISLRTRQRTCSSPKPAFGGKTCFGIAKDEQHCALAPCPVPTPAPIPGGWSAWSEWKKCSKRCGGGIRSRNRTCDMPTPKHGGKYCPGNNIQWENCNTELCPEHKKITPWTQWLPYNITAEGTYHQRFRYICKANIPESNMLYISHPRWESRFCAKDVDNCNDKIDDTKQAVNIDGKWSAWSVWTPCNVMCGGGLMFRERRCANPEPSGNGKDCDGANAQSKVCNTHSCQGVWSCWSEMSSCSASCGRGVRYRRRQCLGSVSGKQFTLPCIGSDHSEEACLMPSCNNFNAGWREWTEWTACVDGQQQRRRHCHIQNPINNECLGDGIQSRQCGEIDIGMEEVQAEEKGPFKIFHLVIVGIIAFALGAILSVLLYIYIQNMREHALEKKHNRLNEKIDRTQHQNLYSVDPASQMGMNLTKKYVSNNSLASVLTGTLQKDKMTVKEATLQRKGSMRTNLSLNDL
ncbi:semaphorin-5A-like [Tubulanus polymorphus]|uniref:semaphorin-5A-like n=1 Tax=Tubulanus polymorphus TaxID=672921 RepID=UPI003DA6BFBC